ncbi:MAG: DoxX family membrane protein [Bacteroidetes bacterium]|nr:MAG: DoxX family membrane protein [Bacteroidota bacterium]
MKLLTGISRVLVGCLFIFSGFIKANDPIGFSYKLTEYYSIFGTGFLQHGEVFQAMLICVIEIVLGVCVLIGTRMKLSSWLLLLMIIFFTFLTGFTAISNWFYENPDHSRTQWFANLLNFNPRELYYMKDCGCFGDFVKLTPWQSFLKDLILLVLIVIIFIRRNHIRAFFAKILQTNLIIFFALLSAFFTTYCYMYTPAFNFLYWDKGNNVIEYMEEIPDEKAYLFVYEKDGQHFTFDMNNLPSDPSYTFVDRFDSITKPGVPAMIHDFHVSNELGDDITMEVLQSPAYQLFIVAYDLNEARVKSFTKFNETAEAFQSAGFKIYAFTSTPPEKVEEFRHEHQLAYPFGQMDRTALKSIIRSNPGFILMKEGVVVEYWSARNVPTMKNIEKEMERYDKKLAKQKP